MEPLPLRDRSQDYTRAGFEKREKRRRIRKLQDAISQNDVKSVKELLQDKFDVDFQYRGQTALQLAVKSGNYDICKLLIAAGADVNKTDAELNNLLNAACWRGYTRVAKLLIDSHADLDVRNDLGCTSLNTCAYKGFADIADILLKANCDPNIPNSRLQTPLYTASYHGHVGVVRSLISAGCQMDIGDDERRTALMIASQLGHLDVVVCLINGDAISNDFLDIALLLIESGADVNQKDRLSQAPIHAAVRHVSQVFGPETEKALVVVQKLVDFGCDINAADNQGWTPLYQGAFAGNKDVTNIMLKNKADLTVKTKTSDTVLHAAASGNCTTVVQMLIDAGCDINVKNGKNQTPLYLACEKGNEAVVQRLIKEKKCLLNGTRPSTIPLHAAIANNHLIIARLLINSGCNINQINDNGLTPIMTAAKENNTKVAKLLLMNGCDLDAHAKVKRLMKCCLLHPDAHPHFDLQPLFLAMTHSNMELMQWFLHCHGNIPYDVIINLSEILLTSQEIQAQFSRASQKNLKALFEQTLSRPRKLQEICRALIREHLGSRPQHKIDRLPVASKLKDYVLMLDLFGTISDFDKECSSDSFRETGSFEYFRRSPDSYQEIANI
ncbi:hypothetical protein KUTeg_002936 [Tegillarca granosa]|uniref:SOCS box domain-containing protein n=1 Tax=Tegillarca granosa TaxID=220873 RepID=A0ABQ9FNL3_TEGGR|nr:hypothetical protein KUTeg_002936 [Tegillarca granosa]